MCNCNYKIPSYLLKSLLNVKFGRTQSLVLPIAGNGISSSTTISGIRTITNGCRISNGGNGGNGPNVIVVNSNQLKSLFPNGNTNLTSSIPNMNEHNPTGGPQVL